MTIIGYSGNWNVKTDVYELPNSVNVTNNTSVVRVDLHVGRNTGTSTSYIWGDFSGSINVDGQSQSFSGNTNGQQYLNAGGYWYSGVTKDFTVTHNNDGTKSVNVSFSWSANFSPYNTNASGTLGLTTIPRKTDCPTLSAIIKTPTGVTIYPKAANTFGHSLKITFGDSVQYVNANGVLQNNEYIFPTNITNIPLTLPKEYYSQFTGITATGTLSLKTYNGNTSIGESTNTLNVSVNQDLCRPYVSQYSVEDANTKTLAITSDSSDTIQYASRILISFTSYYVSDPEDTNTTITLKMFDDTDITSLSSVYAIEKNTNSFLITLKNSRGITGYTTIVNDGDLFSYTPLTFNIEYMKRTEPTTGEVEISYDGNFSQYIKNIQTSTTLATNTLTITWKYREKGTNSWITGGTLTPSINTTNNTYSGNESLGSIFDYRKQYDFLFIAEDIIHNSNGQGTITSPINPIELTREIPRGYPIFWWSENSINMIEKTYLNGGCFDYDETNEIFTGMYWIDSNGIEKPIYKKSFYFTSWSGLGYDTGLSDIETIIDSSVQLKNTNTSQIIKLAYNPNNTYGYYIKQTGNTYKILIQNDGVYTCDGCNVFILYTKTSQVSL